MKAEPSRLVTSGRRRGEAPPRKIFTLPGKNVLDII